MSVDRQLLLETLLNVDGYRKEGVDMRTAWCAHVGPGEPLYWLDPQNEKEFGPNAKYFQHNVAEATKLVKAATGKDKLDSVFNYLIRGGPPEAAVEILDGMFQDSPFNFSRNPMDYVTVWTPKTLVPDRETGGHDFQGIAHAGVSDGFPEVDSFFANHYIQGGTFFKFERDFPDPNDMHYKYMQQQRDELDPNKRIQIIKEFQRYSAEKMYVVPVTGGADTFSLAQPWFGNFGTFRTRGSDLEHTYWIDKSKMKS
jgi:ABC-type transport system substrate-binding protein